MKKCMLVFLLNLLFIVPTMAQETAQVEVTSTQKWKFGLHFDSLSDQQKAFNGLTKGVIINKVSKDHPAEAAHIMVGDILTHVSGIEIIDQAHCVEVMKNLDVSSGVSNLKIIRNGVKMELLVKFE